MAGDIEEFLRRAAQRRQQRANQRNDQQQQATRPKAPQYTDRAAERVMRPSVEPIAEPMMAEVIEDEADEVVASLGDMRRAREATDQRKIDNALSRTSGTTKGEQTRSKSNTPAADLLRILKSPNGLQQAILLREILEPRGKHWD